MLLIRKTKSDVGIFKMFLMVSFMLSIMVVTGSEPAAAVKYQRILVLAKVEPASLKKQFEEAVVSQLKNKGYDAVASHSVISEEDANNLEIIANRIEALGVEAVLAYTVQNPETKRTNTPSVRASVGVPVRIGFMNVYLGGSVPLGGGPKQKKIVNVTAEFYVDKASPEPAMTIPLSGNQAKGTDALINDFAKKSIKSLAKNDLL